MPSGHYIKTLGARAALFTEMLASAAPGAWPIRSATAGTKSPTRNESRDIEELSLLLVIPAKAGIQGDEAAALAPGPPLPRG